VFVVSANSGGGATAFPDGGPTNKDRSFLQFFHAIFVVGYTDQVLGNMYIHFDQVTILHSLIHFFFRKGGKLEKGQWGWEMERP
jgi:hypothetical protein